MIVFACFPFVWVLHYGKLVTRGTCAHLGPCGRLVIHLDPFSIFWGCSDSRHFRGGVVHQSSMSSYTLSSKGRAKDGCILCREYLSWRRSPTSLMTLSACGDIYTIKKLSPWRAICGLRKSEAAPSKILMEKHTCLVRLNHKLGLKWKTPLTLMLQMDPVFPTFHSYYFGAKGSHQ